jgi:hypothetical protein
VESRPNLPMSGEGGPEMAECMSRTGGGSRTLDGDYMVASASPLAMAVVVLMVWNRQSPD